MHALVLNNIFLLTGVFRFRTIRTAVLLPGLRRLLLQLRQPLSPVQQPGLPPAIRRQASRGRRRPRAAVPGRLRQGRLRCLRRPRELRRPLPEVRVRQPGVRGRRRQGAVRRGAPAVRVPATAGVLAAAVRGRSGVRRVAGGPVAAGVRRGSVAVQQVPASAGCELLARPVISLHFVLHS